MKERLRQLTKRLHSSYWDAVDERRVLAQWEQRGSSIEILAEAELYSSRIAGFSSQLGRRTGPRNKTELAIQLAQSSIFENPDLFQFLLSQGREFPLFSRYLLWAEALRSACVVAVSKLESIERV